MSLSFKIYVVKKAFGRYEIGKSYKFGPTTAKRFEDYLEYCSDCNGGRPCSKCDEEKEEKEVKQVLETKEEKTVSKRRTKKKK